VLGLHLFAHRIEPDLDTLLALHGVARDQGCTSTPARAWGILCVRCRGEGRAYRASQQVLGA
jgi:hypothetical protein